MQMASWPQFLSSIGLANPQNLVEQKGVEADDDDDDDDDYDDVYDGSCAIIR